MERKQKQRVIKVKQRGRRQQDGDQERGNGRKIFLMKASERLILL